VVSFKTKDEDEKEEEKKKKREQLGFSEIQEIDLGEDEYHLEIEETFIIENNVGDEDLIEGPEGILMPIEVLDFQFILTFSQFMIFLEAEN